MGQIVFARPRTWYDSYSDLYTLIELSGYPLIYFDEIDPESDNKYILTLVNGENQDGWQSPRAEIVLWDIEWRLDGDYPRIPGVSPELYCRSRSISLFAASIVASSSDISSFF